MELPEEHPTSNGPVSLDELIARAEEQGMTLTDYLAKLNVSQPTLANEAYLKEQLERGKRDADERNRAFMEEYSSFDVEKAVELQRLTDARIRENLLKLSLPGVILSPNRSVSKNVEASSSVEPNPQVVKQRSIENHFNTMPLSEVKRYFSQLTTEKSKNGKSFLSREDVNRFIARAFVGATYLPKLELNLANGEKQFVWSLFYNYYVRCTTNYQYEINSRCKDKYIDLLSDNFTNFTRQQIANNFHKEVGRKWPLTK